MDIDDELTTDIKTSDKSLSSKSNGLMKNSKPQAPAPNFSIGQRNQISGSNQKDFRSSPLINEMSGPQSGLGMIPPNQPLDQSLKLPPSNFPGVQKLQPNSSSGLEVNNKFQSSQPAGNLPQVINPPVINKGIQPTTVFNSSLQMNPNNGSNFKPIEVGQGSQLGNLIKGSPVVQDPKSVSISPQNKPVDIVNHPGAGPSQAIRPNQPQSEAPKLPMEFQGFGNNNSGHKQNPQINPRPNLPGANALNFNHLGQANNLIGPNPPNPPNLPNPSNIFSKPGIPDSKSSQPIINPKMPEFNTTITPFGAKAPDSLKMSAVNSSNGTQQIIQNKANIHAQPPGRLPNAAVGFNIPNSSDSNLSQFGPRVPANEKIENQMKNEKDIKAGETLKEQEHPQKIDIKKDTPNIKPADRVQAPTIENIKSSPPQLIVTHPNLIQSQSSGPFAFEKNIKSNTPIIPSGVIDSSKPSISNQVIGNPNPSIEDRKGFEGFPKIGPEVNESGNKLSQVGKQPAQPVINQFKPNEPKIHSQFAQPFELSKQNLQPLNKAPQQEIPFMERRDFGNNQKVNTIPSLAKQPAKLSQIIKQNTDSPIKLNKIIPKDPINIKVVKMIPDDTYRSQLNLINILSELIDYNSLIIKNQEINEFLTVNSLKGSGECEKILKFVNFKLQCEICQSKNIHSLIELKCKTIVCLNCLLNAGELSIKKNFFECPKCRKIIDEDEQIIIWEKLGKSERIVEREKLEFKLKFEGQLFCSKCEKYKKNFFHGCLHICKECFAADLRKNVVCCKKCGDDMDLDVVLQENFQCKSCESVNYFVGSYGKYVQNETHVLCVSCVYNFFNQGFDKNLRIKLSKLEKIEINDHLFQRCEGCNNEFFKDYLASEICGHMMCQSCRGERACNSCSRPNNS